jgi:hypothetical protein
MTSSWALSDMDEEALRALVRKTVARHLEESESRSPEPRPLPFTSHASHYRYAVPASDDACLIEPTVQCVHCGYCQSHGH